MKPLPPKYAWLGQVEGRPKIIDAAIALNGVTETAGMASTREIMAWADEVGLKASYPTDGVAWCGLFAAVVVKRAGWDVVAGPLWARNWANFGRAVDPRHAALGDVLVFSRPGGGGHVGFYVGEDDTAFHVLGGNQSDAVGFTRILKTRLLAARRPKWRVAQPAGVKKFVIDASGAVSANEA